MIAQPPSENKMTQKIAARAESRRVRLHSGTQMVASLEIGAFPIGIVRLPPVGYTEMRSILARKPAAGGPGA